ncbi:beta-lactamase family protein [Microbispora sp. NEAU-D428]|uniref:serine hydrolase domain-containing protein n=1 Tax=Microbispora sitophila TaxID=2771537 RepID=UPI0018691A99|nr:serine hydrolase domain-containing protein [Microbispora sitophila]MBE3012018.1 beta-lactamase family protein [Microbispora sitophila]
MLTRRDSLRLLAGAVVGAAALPARSAIAADTPPPWTVTGASSPSLQPFDDLLRSFMEARSISYASLAVVRQGKLVLARGYNSTSGPVLAQPTSLFRLASMSKPVTATAIMKLVQDGRLSLSATVAPMLGLSTAADDRLGKVTVLHLLQHLGGWDRSASKFDPMYRGDFTVSSALHVPLPVTQANIMDYMSTRRLDVDPGSRYAYSNYGYMLLGKVIEKVTGLPYATYVQQNVLAPVKITRMVQGRTAQSLRRPSEVPYHSQYSDTTVLDNSGAQVPMPYGTFNLENMAAHGAWLSSAVDMAKFTTIFDAPGLLTSSTIAQAFAAPDVEWDGWYYGMGWSVRPIGGGLSTWHDGTYPGTSTLMVRRFDGLSWVVLFNRWNDALGQSFTDDIDYPLHVAADNVTSWPTTDLFPYYGL